LNSLIWLGNSTVSPRTRFRFWNHTEHLSAISCRSTLERSTLQQQRVFFVVVNARGLRLWIPRFCVKMI
jgi:hypothetical protein